MQNFKSTGLGIKSNDPRHWLPNPAKSVVMSSDRFKRFMSSDSRSFVTPGYTRAYADAVGVTGVILPTPTLSSL